MTRGGSARATRRWEAAREAFATQRSADLKRGAAAAYLSRISVAPCVGGRMLVRETGHPCFLWVFFAIGNEVKETHLVKNAYAQQITSNSRVPFSLKELA